MEEVKKILSKNETSSEKYWIMLFRLPGVLIFFLPFIPISISYVNTEVEKIGLDGSDWKMLGIGFFLVWGSSYFGILANKLGAYILKKLGL